MRIVDLEKVLDKSCVAVEKTQSDLDVMIGSLAELKESESFCCQYWGLRPCVSRVVALVATGATNSAIAEYLSLSTNTVRNYLAEAFQLTGANSRTQLAVQVIRASRTTHS